MEATFEPSSDLIQEEDCDTLLLYLPGFTKEQLKVQLTRTRGLKISGSRHLENNNLSSFLKDFHVPHNCDTNKIRAKFEDGILYIRLPKIPQPPTPNKAAQIVDEIKQTATAKKSDIDEKKSSEGEGGKNEGVGKRAEEKSGGNAAGSGRGVEADYEQLDAAAARLMAAARNQITNALVLLPVVGLAIYVSKLPYFSNP